MRLPRLLSLLILAAWATASVAEPPSPTLSAPVVLAADAKQPQVVVGRDGLVYVTFLRGGNVVLSVSKDRGKTFSEPTIAMDAQGKARGGAQRGPRVGVDAKGGLVITAPFTYDSVENAKQYPTPELYVATSADGGATWSGTQPVNGPPKSAPEGLHAMRVAPSGTVHAAWLEVDRGAKGQNLRYARIGPGGGVTTLASKICECCAPGLALDGAGNPVVAWREGGDKDSRELFVARSTDGGRTFSAPRQLNRLPTKEGG